METEWHKHRRTTVSPVITSPSLKGIVQKCVTKNYKNGSVKMTICCFTEV